MVRNGQELNNPAPITITWLQRMDLQMQFGFPINYSLPSKYKRSHGLCVWFGEVPLPVFRPWDISLVTFQEGEEAYSKVDVALFWGQAQPVFKSVQDTKFSGIGVLWHPQGFRPPGLSPALKIQACGIFWNLTFQSHKKDRALTIFLITQVP